MSTTISLLRWSGGAALVLLAWAAVMVALPFVGPDGRLVAVVGDGAGRAVAAAGGRVIEVREGAVLARSESAGFPGRLYRHGALLVLERETGLEEYIATGRRLDAEPSEELIAGIFYRNSPLHDGAAILRGDRIVAAACTLPLSETPLPQHYGTRHRAALGISERTDAVAVVLSEETGEIAIAVDGRLTSRLDGDGLRQALRALVGSAQNGHVALNGTKGTKTRPEARL